MSAREFFSGPGDAPFRILAENTSDGIVTIDIGSTIVYANAAVHRIFGYAPEELVGKSLTLLMPNALRSTHQTAVARYLRTGKRHISWEGIELPGLHRTGRPVTVEIAFGESVFDGQRLFTGIIRDITDRKRVERRRAIEAAVTRVLVENQSASEIPTAVLKTLCSTVGWKIGELWTVDARTGELRPGATWHEADSQLEKFVHSARSRTFKPGIGLPGRVLETGAAAWIADLASDETVIGQDVALRAGLRSAAGFPIQVEGKIIAVMTFFHPLVEDPDPELGEAFMIIGSQIGQFMERRRAEEEKEMALANEQKARRAAEETNRLKDEFLGILSHELRTPMTSIVGWSCLLMEKSLNPVQIEHAIEIIARNADSQTHLIDELLDLSRTMTGKVQLNIEPLMPAAIVQAAVDAVRVTADAKNIQIELMLDSEAGPVSGDSHRLDQVVWNLLTNAVKFTPKNGRVQIILERQDSYVQLRVSDTGIGLAPEFLPFVFDRFVQADASTTREHGGLGIGLALVRQIVELHGGTATASSPGRNQGATFTVRLPIRVIHEDASHDVAPAESTVSFVHPEARAAELKDLRILAVDDDAGALELVRFILQAQGANVLTVTSAREAISAVDTFQPELLISDIGMPGDDGYALIQKVRAREVPSRHIPALALTAYARPEDRTRALWTGYDTHLAKPVTPDTLVAVVATLARRAQRKTASSPDSDTTPGQ